MAQRDLRYITSAHSAPDGAARSPALMSRSAVQPGFSFLAIFIATGLCQLSGAGDAALPRLDQLAGDWLVASELHSLPALNSTLGSSQVANDLLALTNLGYPPITLTGDTGGLEIDGAPVKLDGVRWFPDHVLRRGSHSGLQLESSVQMLYQQRGVLFRLTLDNRSEVARVVSVRIKLSARTSRHEVWRWKIPRDAAPGRFSASVFADGHGLLETDSRRELANAFAFAIAPDALRANGETGEATWHVRLAPGAIWTTRYTLALGEAGPELPALALRWAENFDEAWSRCSNDWQERFSAMFTPGNPYFSGHLPRLETADEKLRRVYYMSVVSLLSIYRTGLPEAPRTYISNSPESNTIMMYFWDTREWATALALLDPVMLKSYLRAWLAKGIYHGYAEEYLTGTLQGPWYSANDLSIFILAEAYLNTTGDRAFLEEKIAGRTLLEHLDGIAVNWQSLVRPGRILADYGEADNLLECVPTYIHEVASFNAANIWMMRRVAALQDTFGQAARARELRESAARLLPAVLELYEPGQGVWSARHRDGTRVQIRHVFDFATIGLTIPDELSPRMRHEMTGFVQRELLVDDWMRAQSLSDPAASVSNRPDHGPMGAYCAWPGETMAAMCEFGEYSAALDLLHRCAAVTREGPFSQSRQLLTTAPNSRVVISPGPQTYNASNGGSFAETIIREFFGFQPDLLHPGIFLAHPRPARGFSGRLLGVEYGGRTLDFRSTAGGVEVTPRAAAQTQR